MKAWLLVLCLASASCAGNRELLSIRGTITFADGLPPPPGYVLTLRERRSGSFRARLQQPFSLDSMFTIAVIAPSQDGSFALDAYVCEDVSFGAIYAGGAVGQRDDPIWRSPIHILANETETRYIRTETWPRRFDGLDYVQAEAFAQSAAELGGAERVPCTYSSDAP